MTIQEVADYLKISVHTVYNMARRGQIPCIKVGRQWRFRQADIYNLFVQQYYQHTKKPTDATLRSSSVLRSTTKDETLRSTRKK